MASSNKKSLQQIAREKQTAVPSHLGDLVSLKAETSDSQHTEPDKPNRAPIEKDDRSLKEVAEDKMKQNPSMLGDPVSLKAETSDTEPTQDDRGTLGTHKTGQPKL